MLAKADKNRAAANRKMAAFWLKCRKAVQILALAGFCGLFLISRPGNTNEAWIGLVFRFDPLVALGSMLSSRTFLIDTSIGLGLSLLLAVVAGRAWCGWLCPLGTLLDWFHFKKKPTASLPEALRGAKYGLLLVILFAALMGNLTLLFLDPLTILYRSLTITIFPALNQIIVALENALYPIAFFQPPISWLEGVLRPSILPESPQYFPQSMIFGIVFVGIILLNGLAPRFWCRYLCPLGGLLGWVSKISIFRRGVTAGACRDCALCERRCPTGTINPEEGYRSDPAECIVCLDCFPGCGESGLQVSNPLKPAARNAAYDPGRRAFLGAAAAAVSGIAVLGTEGALVKPDPHSLRPPGTTNESLLSACTRCGVCMRVCPTNALQPGGLNFGLVGLCTPVIIPRYGYCDYTCNRCGQVCPVHAIPNVSLEEKRTQVIGKAYLDENRCLAWSDHLPCIVCEEMCPVPEKAIQLSDLEVTDADGQKRTIKLPHVDRTRCIGCGICEYKCPVGGESAIQVYAANPDALF